jgi:hypothetical protein
VVKHTDLNPVSLGQWRTDNAEYEDVADVKALLRTPDKFKIDSIISHIKVAEIRSTEARHIPGLPKVSYACAIGRME